jgi:hypothetical protein
MVPPGEAPSRTSPTASSGASENSSAIPKASSGETASRLASPIATPFGYTSTRRKSSGVSDSPRLTMITASASGSSASVNTEPSIGGDPIRRRRARRRRHRRRRV